MNVPPLPTRFTSIFRGRGRVWLALLIPTLTLLVGGYVRRWAGDDGFINLRVVDQLLEGHGFVYNAGERSEAVTSALWIFVLWLLGVLGFNTESAAWLVGLAGSGLGTALVVLAAARLSADEEEAPLLPLGALAYAAIPVAWDYATSALENGLGLAYLGAAYYLVARVVSSASRRGARWAGVFVGLAPLLRPDYALYGLALGLVLLAAVPRWRERALVAAALASVGVSFQLFRMGYFAALVPNTALAKEAFDARWEQGLLYLRNTVGSYALLAPLTALLLSLLPLLASHLRARRPLHAALMFAMASAGLVHGLYVVRVGGDFMHGRMLLPGLFAIFASVAAIRVRFELSPERVRALAAVLVVSVWAVVCASFLRAETWEYNSILDERKWYSDSSKSPYPTHLHHYSAHPFYRGFMGAKARVAEGCPHSHSSLEPSSSDACERIAIPDTLDGVLSDRPEGVKLALDSAMVAPEVVAVIGFRPLGISGKAAGTRINITDTFGLTDVVASRMELHERGRPGHEKAFTTPWFAAKYGAASATQDGRVQAAKRALGCGMLRELHRATHEPMSVSRFFRNMALSFSLHRLRVPADPFEAERKFCKPS